MPLTQFKTQTTTGIPIHGEYEGNEQSGKAIIFSHGFGVTRNDGDLFPDLSKPLKDDFLLVRFDYNVVNQQENLIKVRPFSVLADILRQVRQFVHERFSMQETNIVAHSMGCVTVAAARLNDIKQTILLAGPIQWRLHKMQDYFAKRPKTKISETETSIIQRSDGSLTYVEPEFWQELKQMQPAKLYQQLAEISHVTFIKPKQDQVITDDDPAPIKNTDNIKLISLDGDHDFSGEDRGELTSVIYQLLK